MPALPAYAAGPLPLPDVRLLTCWLDDDRDIALAQARAVLSPDEIRRAERFHFARDRDRYARGRGFLRRALAASTGQEPGAIRFRLGPKGKPALADGGPEFNLSHSGGLAVLAISDDGPVGVDVELSDRRVDGMALAGTVFTEAERVCLAALPEADRRLRFLAFWTAKEARMKLTGEGMSLPPRSISLDLSGDWPRTCLLPEQPHVRLQYPRLEDQDAICCIATLARP